MASGLLSLKWNNHRTTFFHVLSTVRSKESYCDVTLACDGKFYPVHKLVLSTCSDYFERMFERTNCKHPIIVLKDIRHEELEALLNYMYVGEVNVLQNELAGLIKAAECLMIKGLAVPDEAPTKESKRSSQNRDDSPHAKRRKRDEDGRPSSHNQHLHREGREPPTLSSSHSQRQSSSASLPNPSPSVARVAPPPISPSPSVGSVSDAVSEECSQSQSETNEAQESSKHLGSEPTSSQPQQPVPEVILDDSGVKEEPADIEEEVTETKEVLESQFFDPLQEGDSRSDPGGGSGGYDSQMLSSQPQSMEELVAQAIPGSSGLQGNSLWEGDGSLQGFPMEGFSGDGSRPPQMAKRSGEKETGRVQHHRGFYHLPTAPIESYTSRGRGMDARASSQKSCKTEDDSSGGSHPSDAHPAMRSLAPLNLQMYSVSAPRSVFACFLCGKTFGLKHNLYRHLRTHTGERPHQCPHCEYRGTRKSHVLTHINRVHLRHEQVESSVVQPSVGTDQVGASQPTSSPI